MAGVAVLLQLSSSASSSHPGRQAFYGLYEPMLRAPGREWPYRYNRFSGGVVVMDPFNVTAATVAEVKATLNATVLM